MRICLLCLLNIIWPVCNHKDVSVIVLILLRVALKSAGSFHWPISRNTALIDVLASQYPTSWRFKIALRRTQDSEYTLKVVKVSIFLASMTVQFQNQVEL